ncbi:two-component system sensor histidine kinase NtrB [Azonexus hydrophilus]|uniref:histidine kinase n=1 Tax=Azonexus hydrophilus TaxID=418702 RepID=A0ABZ2XK56_9RHOO|nr:ATP-binding protein [Azonexus hydrophilus]
MQGWLTTTWEPNWRSFRYFVLYRLLLGGLCLLGLVFPGEWNVRLNLLPSVLLYTLVGAYFAAMVSGYFLARFWQQHFNFQLSFQVLADVLVISVLMFIAGGVSSGLGLVLLISLAAASLVGQGRLVLFYAALATLAALMSQSFGILYRGFDPGSIVQAGFLSAGYFATAILARLLGQRIMINEDLARRRGIALDNQIRINQRVVERMQDGVLIVAPDGQVVRYNPMAARLLGLPSVAGQLVDNAPTLAAGLAHWLAGGDDSVLFFGAGNSELGARFESTASSDGDVLIFVEDVGRIKEQAKQLKLAALGRLTASIAHEIRNPLSAISHASELLQEERRGEIFERLLRIIGDNTARLDRIVSDVLELGRQNQAQVEIIALREFLGNFAVELLANENLPASTIALDVPPGKMICFDRSHLHQVLWNLVGNALRHASRGPGSVRIVFAGEDVPGRVELHVIDDGPGVPEALRDQIFEPFFTTHTLGTGLGLFIARELCVANGGALVLRAGGGGGHFIVSGRSDTCQSAVANDALAAS